MCFASQLFTSFFYSSLETREPKKKDANLQIDTTAFVRSKGTEQFEGAVPGLAPPPSALLPGLAVHHTLGHIDRKENRREALCVAALTDTLNGSGRQ